MQRHSKNKKKVSGKEANISIALRKRQHQEGQEKREEAGEKRLESKRRIRRIKRTKGSNILISPHKHPSHHDLIPVGCRVRTSFNHVQIILMGELPILKIKYGTLIYDVNDKVQNTLGRVSK
jgi:hypothetical protein